MLKSTDISFSLEDDKVIKRVVAKCKLGDWFLLTLVKKNLDDRQFTSWLKEVGKLYFPSSCSGPQYFAYLGGRTYQWDSEEGVAVTAPGGTERRGYRVLGPEHSGVFLSVLFSG